MKTSRLKWGIMGSGRIAEKVANALAASKTGQLVAVGSRRRETALAFAQKMRIDTAHHGYDAVLADPNVQAVYIALPNHLHARWAVLAAEAGKHILCEKPLALNQFEAETIIEAARRYDVFLMEAFMYRCHFQTARLVQLVAHLWSPEANR